MAMPPSESKWTSSNILPEAFIELGTCLLTRFFSAYSLWGTNGSELVNPSLLVYKDCRPQPLFPVFSPDTGNGSVEPTWLRSPPLSLLRLPKADGARQPPRNQCWDFIQWRSRGRSTVGKVRELNEDAFLENPESGVWAVADGMGGHMAGDEASQGGCRCLDVHIRQ